MNVKKRQDYFIEIDPDIENLEKVRGPFTEFLKHVGLTEKDQLQWMLSFCEVVTNAIVHGSDPKASDSVQVKWAREGNRIILSVKDCGVGPKAYRIENPELPTDPLAMSGRGLYIMDDFVDIWLHMKTLRGYSQTLIKYF